MEREFECETKKEAISRFCHSRCGYYEQRLWEDEDGIKMYSRDVDADFGAVLYRWDGMENDAWLEYHCNGHVSRSLDELYRIICDENGVEPMENFKKDILYEGYGDAYWLTGWFPGIPGKGPEYYFQVSLRTSSEFSRTA